MANRRGQRRRLVAAAGVDATLLLLSLTMVTPSPVTDAPPCSIADFEFLAAQDARDLLAITSQFLGDRRNEHAIGGRRGHGIYGNATSSGMPMKPGNGTSGMK